MWRRSISRLNSNIGPLRCADAICRRSLEIGLGPRTDVVVNEFERGDGYQTTREDDQADPDVAS